jgi:hypothetical protein
MPHLKFVLHSPYCESKVVLSADFALSDSILLRKD